MRTDEELIVGETYVYVRGGVAYLLERVDDVKGRIVLTNTGEDAATVVDEAYFRAHFRRKP